HPEIGIINILNPDGTINENGGKYKGLDRYKAREAVIKDMEGTGFYENKEDRVIPLKFSDRSKTPIEPYLSDQWFVKMGDRDDGKPGFAQMAMDAVTGGRVKFFPVRYANTYLEWLGEKRDWCISRQLWWGHRIPVWSRPKHEGETWTRDAILNYLRQFVVLPGFHGDEQRARQAMEDIDCAYSAAHLHLCIKTPEVATAIRETLETKMGSPQDPDVLDPWFSSMLWTHSTFGWPDKTPELDYYYPPSTLVTSRDIITLWVARMVIAGLYNLDDIPFHHVYITPKVLDGFGEGMSKSKGNGVDPLDIIELYGADALRFQMVSIAGETQDSKLPVSNVCPH